jgi:hypothetical protein
LYAIVSNCTSANTTTNRNSSSNSDENYESPFECLTSLTFDDDDEELNPFYFPNLAAKPRNNNCLQELQDSYKSSFPSQNYFLENTCFLILFV